VVTDPVSLDLACTSCAPCPGRGVDGHGMSHCAECCYGTLVDADPACPVHGDPRLHLDDVADVLPGRSFAGTTVDLRCGCWLSSAHPRTLFPPLSSDGRCAVHFPAADVPWRLW
jgi:hypothetical protein